MEMNQAPKAELLIRIGNWIKPRLDLYELIIGLCFGVALIVQGLTELSLNIVLICTLGLLAGMYFFTAYSELNISHTGGLEIFYYKLSALSLSVGVVGILFKLEYWHGASYLITASSVSLLILFPFMLYTNIRKPELKIFNTRLLVRVFVIAIAGLLINVRA
jgi:hypothetical protein